MTSDQVRCLLDLYRLCMLAEEVRLLKEQRRKLWMLLDDIDTLDDSCRDNDNAFRQAARKRQRQRFEIWNPVETPDEVFAKVADALHVQGDEG